MPRSHSCSVEEQPSTSASKSAEDMSTSAGRPPRRQKKISKIGRSYSSPVEIKGASADTSNVELLNPKPNGTAMEDASEESRENKTPIRWMWKKALKSLKTKDRDKDRDKDKDKDKGREDRGADKSSSERDDKRAYSRMVTECFYPLSLHMSDKQIWPMNSRQSSLKKGLLKRKDSKEQAVTEEEPEVTDEAEIDPVYSLLKCAADLPRQNKGQQHTCCLQRTTDNLTVRVHSGSTSPSSAPQSPPPVSRRRPKLNMRMKSCSVDTPGERPAPAYLSDDTMKGSESYSSAPGGFVEYLWRGSQSRMSSHGSTGSDYDRKLSTSPKPGQLPPSPGNSRGRRRKLNMRMKSFSVDTPEPPKPSFDESSKKKSISFTSATSCFGAPASPLPGVTRRARFLLGSGSVDIEDGYDSLSPRSNQSLSPRSGSPMTVKCKSHNVYVVLYSYRPRVRGDIELRAGSRVTVMDMNDPDWWKGRSNGRYGYFPSSYVMKINNGEKPLQVVTGVEVTKGQKETKLLKDQIVVCETELPEEDDMVIIRTSDNTRLPCPLRYLAEVVPS